MNMASMGIYQFTSVFYKHDEVANCFVCTSCCTVSRKGISFYVIDIPLVLLRAFRRPQYWGGGEGRKFKYEFILRTEVKPYFSVFSYHSWIYSP
jgi:hypothetical protein